MSSLIIFLPCRGGGILHIMVKFKTMTRFYPKNAQKMFRKSGKIQAVYVQLNNLFLQN